MIREALEAVAAIFHDRLALGGTVWRVGSYTKLRKCGLIRGLFKKSAGAGLVPAFVSGVHFSGRVA